ncbi:MAG: hypothetical protein WD023_03880 [Ilumatobacteraceae bacterium]
MSAPDSLPAGSVVPVPGLVVAPSRRRLVLVASATLYVCGTIGSIIGPAMIDEHPRWVLLLGSRNRNLLGSVPYIDGVSFALIGFCRVLLAGVVLFFLGRWYGTKAVEWTEGQVGEMPAFYRWTLRGIDRFGWLMLVVMPGSNLVCILAGHRQMAVRRFLTFLCTGIVIKLTFLWVGGNLIEDQIKWFLEAINSYQWYIVAALFAIVMLQSARQVRTAGPEIIDEIETPDGIIEPHVPHHRPGVAPADHD